MKPETKHSRQCEDPACSVCASWRQEKRERAGWYLLARRRRQDGSQATLDGF